MKKRTRNILRGLLAILLVFSLGMLARQALDNSGGSSSYDQALALASQGSAGAAEETVPQTEAAKTEWLPEPVTDDPVLEELAALELSALRQVNPDVIGWIRIPDSNIDYPILQGEDNDYYLKHTWDGKENSVGSIFMEHRNTPDFTDYNTILYGHNMNDGSMFANIKRYSTEWYWERHPYVYILTDRGAYRYEVFSAYETTTDSVAYGLSFNQGETRAAFLENAIRESSADMGIRPEPSDRMLTLSTCSGLGQTTRWVLHARLKMLRTETP